MKLRKKALLPAIAMVLASVIALSGVTYAWFTTGITAQVEDLDVNVATANGLQVSLDAASWKTIITADDVRNAIGDAGAAYGNRKIQYPTTEISPVSSAGVIDANGLMEMFLGTLDNGKLISSRETEANTSEAGNFVAFDLFIKSSTDQWPLILKMGDSSVTGINIETGDATTIGTEKAVRVAFVPMGYASTAAAARSLNSIPDSINESMSLNGKAIIWEPNAGTRATAVDAADGKLSYYGFCDSFDTPMTEAEVIAAGKAASVSTTTTDIQFPLGAGINKIRVYIWLEGQDIDCINDISNGDFRVNLFFTLPDAAAEG